MRHPFLVPLVLIGAAVSAPAQVGISIGISFPVYPDLVRVPGYPVYYAPDSDANYFFYDGMYWVFQGYDWYTSSWYDGPWYRVEPEVVPYFILRVPVRYYRRPPAFFGSWQRSAPPRWGEHWGHRWEQQRRGWNRWDHNEAPAPARLPTYQRNYSGNRYPGADQQRDLRTQNYRYQPKERVVQEHYRQQKAQAPSTLPEPGRQRAPEPSRPRQREYEPRQPNPVNPAPRAPQARPDEPQPRQPRPTEPQPRQPRPTEPQPRQPRPVEPQPRQPQPNQPRPDDLRQPRPAPSPQPGGRESSRPQPPQGRERVPEGRPTPNEPKPPQGRNQEKDRDRHEERPK